MYDGVPAAKKSVRETVVQRGEAEIEVVVDRVPVQRLALQQRPCDGERQRGGRNQRAHGDVSERLRDDSGQRRGPRSGRSDGAVMPPASGAFPGSMRLRTNEANTISAPAIISVTDGIA